MARGAVVVVGSANVDAVVAVPRLPRPGETVTDGAFVERFGGKGANQAAAAARLGVPTWLVATVGPDDAGERTQADLQAYGVDVSFVSVGEQPTGIALIVVDGEGANLIAVAPGANAELSGDLVCDALSSIDAERVVVLASLEVTDDAVAAAAEVAAARGWTFVLNPAPARPLSPELLARCDVLTPNEHELETLGTGAELNGSGVGAVVVTRGAQGIDVWRDGELVQHQDAYAADVVDTTGAGDASSGALAFALAEGWGLTDAVRAAAAAGALATRAVGARASLPTRAELDGLLRQ